MAKRSLIEKAKRKAKFSVRAYTRCILCGRPRSVIRDYKICRLCFRDSVHKGLIPGIKKASW